MRSGSQASTLDGPVFVRRRARFRGLVELLAIAVLASACGSASPATSGQRPALSAAPLGSLSPIDATTVASLVAGGWSEGEAIVIALTKITIVSEAAHDAHVLLTLPTGETADINVSWTPASAGDPTDYETTNAQTEAGATIELSYYVSNATASSHTLVASLTGVAALTTADDAGADVLITAFLKKSTEAAFDLFITYVEEYLKAEGKVDPFVQYAKSIGSIFEAWDLKKKSEGLFARIDAAEKCAKDPTNKTTIDAYAADPGLRDRLLQEVADTRSSVRANTKLAFLMMLNEGVGDLAKQPWLGVLLGAGDAVASDNFDKDNGARVSALEQSIVRCGPEPTGGAVAWVGKVTFTETTAALTHDEGCSLQTSCHKNSMTETSTGLVQISINPQDLIEITRPGGEGQSVTWEAPGQVDYSRFREDLTHASDIDYTYDTRQVWHEDGAGTPPIRVSLVFSSDGMYEISFGTPDIDTAIAETATNDNVCATKSTPGCGGQPTFHKSESSTTAGTWGPRQPQAGSGAGTISGAGPSGTISGTGVWSAGTLKWTLTWAFATPG